MGSLSIDEAALMPNLRWHLQGTEGAGITCNLIWNLPLLLVCKRYLYSQGKLFFKLTSRFSLYFILILLHGYFLYIVTFSFRWRFLKIQEVIQLTNFRLLLEVESYWIPSTNNCWEEQGLFPAKLLTQCSWNSREAAFVSYHSYQGGLFFFLVMQLPLSYLCS